MIDIRNLNYSYPGTKRNVFTDFSLGIEGGHVYGLLGKNGTGKSTLLYLISGLLRPGKGSTVMLNGMESRRRLPEMLSDVYLVAEEDILPGISLQDYVRTYGKFYPHFSSVIMEQCLADFEMDTDIRNLHALSMGQRKKVMMSFALASGCSLLLMDEPTNGLDIPSKALFRKVVAKNMTDDRTIIISTHQVHDVEALLDHIIIIDNSRVLMNSSVSEVTNRYAFRTIGTDEVNNPGVLYCEACPMGMAAIVNRHGDDEETQINLELLFDYVLSPQYRNQNNESKSND